MEFLFIFQNKKVFFLLMIRFFRPKSNLMIKVPRDRGFDMVEVCKMGAQESSYKRKEFFVGKLTSFRKWKTIFPPFSY